MKKENSPIKESLLLKYVAGELPESECHEVELWITASEENRATAQQLYDAILMVNTLEALDTCHPEEALRQVKQRTTVGRRNNLLHYTQRIAALLFLPLCVAFLYTILPKDEEIHYTEVTTNPGMVSSIELPDGSKAWLNSNSTLRYPNHFHGATREVSLAGEGYFEVKKQLFHRKKCTFIVNTQTGISVEVLGTSFNVDAYPHLPNTIVSLAEGAVNVSYFTADGSTTSERLTPHEKLVYNLSERDAYISETEVVTETSWKDGSIVLRSSSLEEVVNQLCKRYDIVVSIKRQAICQYTFTGVFHNMQLDRVLEHLRISSGIRYEIKPSRSPYEKSEVILY